jgi:hypothetical protein
MHGYCMDENRIIAMWSGPRNVSTALMYSFAQRLDTVVWDEPYYAAWLARTGEQHPMRDDILAAGLTDAQSVATRIRQRQAQPVHYQKHMTHHMLPDMALDEWFDHATHAFLIREPAAVLTSYTAKYDTVSLELIGYPQQAELFDRAADRLGHAPPVIHGKDLQQNPSRTLKALTTALDLPFDAAMLQWPAGPKPYDGAWAPHWYDRVWASTGFATPEDKASPDLPPALARIADAAQPMFERLARYSIIL